MQSDISNLPHLVEAALLLLIAFLIGCVIGLVLRRQFFPPKPDDLNEVSVPTSLAPSVPPTAIPQSMVDHGRLITLEAPKGGRKDNLKLIKGVGPKIEATLNELGIFHFTDRGLERANGRPGRYGPVV